MLPGVSWGSGYIRCVKEYKVLKVAGSSTKSGKLFKRSVTLKLVQVLPEKMHKWCKSTSVVGTVSTVDLTGAKGDLDGIKVGHLVPVDMERISPTPRPGANNKPIVRHSLYAPLMAKYAKLNAPKASKKTTSSSGSSSGSGCSASGVGADQGSLGMLALFALMFLGFRAGRS